jgi:cytochrome bd-type quinol oxidase subunit 2
MAHISSGLTTEGEIQARARRIASRAWLGTVLLTALGTAATFFVRPDLLANFATRPWGDALPVVAVGGLLLVRRFNATGRDGSSLIASAAFLMGILG